MIGVLISLPNHWGMASHRYQPGIIRVLRIIVGICIISHSSSAHAVTLATQVQTINHSSPVYIDSNYGGFLKFNSKLGTLRSVTLKVNSINIGGSFIFTQGSTGSSTIKSFAVDVLFYAASNLSNTANDGLLKDFDVGILPKTGSLSVTNQILPKTITRRTSVTFNFDPAQNILTEPIVILNLSATKDLAFYQGQGISFAPAFTSVTQFLMNGTISGSPIRDDSRVTSSMNLSLYYDYIPATIPEPSYYGVGLSLATLGVCLGRTYTQRKDQPPAG
jgi:hypothetical protein